MVSMYIFEGPVILLLYPYLFIICICYKILYSFLFEKLIDLFKTFNYYGN